MNRIAAPKRDSSREAGGTSTASQVWHHWQTTLENIPDCTLSHVCEKGAGVMTDRVENDDVGLSLSKARGLPPVVACTLDSPSHHSP